MNSKKAWSKPSMTTEKCFETSALSCGKNASVTGTRHFAYSYDTFTGHLGPGFEGNSSSTGNGGVGFGPSGASQSYAYSGLCSNWVLVVS